MQQHVAQCDRKIHHCEVTETHHTFLPKSRLSRQTPIKHPKIYNNMKKFELNFEEMSLSYIIIDTIFTWLG